MSWSLVQKSASAGSSGAGTLPGGSTASNLLIAVMTGFTDPDTISGSSGWAQAVKGVQTSAGVAAIWYYANNPGGISSATFTDSASALADIWLAEFSTSGVAGAAVATTGTGSASSGNTCVATASSANAAGDLAICIFNEFVFGGSWTTPSGWTVLGSDAGSIAFAFSGYQLSAASGTLSVTGHESLSGSWAGAVATFSVGATISGTASIAGAGTVSAAGSQLFRAAASISGAGSVSAAATQIAGGIAALAGAGTVSAFGTGAGGNTSIAGAGTVTAAGDETLRAAASLSGSGSVTAAPGVTSDDSGAFFSFF